MEDKLEEKTLYEAINRIRYISKKRPHEDNILKQASKTSGLAVEHLRKTLSSLVDKGNICISNHCKVMIPTMIWTLKTLRQLLNIKISLTFLIVLMTPLTLNFLTHVQNFNLMNRIVQSRKRTF